LRYGYCFPIASTNWTKFTVAREMKTGLADVAGQFPKLSADEALKQDYLAWDKVHLGARGHAIACEAVFQTIQSAK
jgi:phospholipase/lecithinase/hemolysin